LKPKRAKRLPRFAQQLNGLLNAIESADRTPPSQVIAEYQQVLQKLKHR
jgi:hypothetical protein